MRNFSKLTPTQRIHYESGWASFCSRVIHCLNDYKPHRDAWVMGWVDTYKAARDDAARARDWAACGLLDALYSRFSSRLWEDHHEGVVDAYDAEER